jgi:uncharacterized surface protein with fasciclin (FAS1) repeats
MKKIIVSTVTLASLTLPLLNGVAHAQSTTTSTPSTTVAAPNLQKIVTPSNAAAQRTNKSTELVSTSTSAAVSAWDLITKDAQLTEFASLVKATGTEKLFSRTDGSFTYLLPTNDAFTVLDQAQLARLKETRFKDQATSIVRQHVLVGKAGFVEFTRGLASAPRPVSATPTTVPERRVDSVITESGKTMSVRATVRPDATGTNRFSVVIGTGGLIEAADYPVLNGLVHITETLQMPAPINSITDIVGRRAS